MQISERGAENFITHDAARILLSLLRSRRWEFREMKALLALGIMVLASAGCGAANAAPSAYSDFIVISVAPRSPNVKPLVMSIAVKDRRKHAAPLQVAALDANR